MHPVWFAAIAAWLAAFAVIAAILADRGFIRRAAQIVCVVFCVSAFGALAMGAIQDAAVIAAGGAGGAISVNRLERRALELGSFAAALASFEPVTPTLEHIAMRDTNPGIRAAWLGVLWALGGAAVCLAAGLGVGAAIVAGIVVRVLG